jgi:hypothetical protein
MKLYFDRIVRSGPSTYTVDARLEEPERRGTFQFKVEEGPPRYVNYDPAFVGFVGGAMPATYALMGAIAALDEAQGVALPTA